MEGKDMRKNLYLFMGAGALAATALVGCDVEEDCTSDADCGGFICEIADGETEGTCLSECTTALDCSVGFTCDENNACVTDPGAQCTADADCGGAYGCDTATGACFNSCTDGSECVDGAQCTEGVCELMGADPYGFAAVVSEIPATAEDVTDTNTPGPDIDAIGYTEPGTGNEFFASTVANSLQGSAGGDGNEAANTSDATGQPNVVPDAPSDDCSFDSGYWSMGANDGFGVFSFSGAAELGDGGSITVYEIGTDRCTNAATRADAYSVWIGQASTAATADAIRNGWCAVGTSGAEGGVFTGTINLATCPTM